MGFLSSLGSSIVNTTKQSAKQGLVNGILSASKGSYTEYTGGVSEADFSSFGRSPLNLPELTDVSNSESHKESKPGVRLPSPQNIYAMYNASTRDANLTDYGMRGEVASRPNNILEFDTLRLPNWGYDSFINERSSFQKGLAGPLGDPGYFYFKIFFNFNTAYGLFGNILNNESLLSGRDGSGHVVPASLNNPFFNSTNTAISYLYLCKDNYAQERIMDRMNTLIKFTKILSFINSQSPWFFKGISGLDKANIPVMNDFSKERSLEIECLEDAIDMRLTTLMDLYKYSVYDDYNNKEIVPENLRKFDMSVLLFAAPVKYLHTAFGEPNKTPTYKYKGFYPNEYGSMPSFKLYTFMNCEFDLESLGAMIPGSMTNDNPFQFGKSKIKIKYDKVVTHTMNEFNEILFGTNGVYYDQYYEFTEKNPTYSSFASDQFRRYEERRKAYEQKFKNISGHYDAGKNEYAGVVDAAEAIAHTNLMKLSGYSLGNIYGEDRMIRSDYWKQKMNWQFGKNISTLQDVGTNVLLKLMGSHYNASARLHKSASGETISEDGWLPGAGPRAVGSQYWKDKIASLKQGKKIASGATKYLDQQQRAGNFSFKQSLYDMFRN